MTGVCHVSQQVEVILMQQSDNLTLQLYCPAEARKTNHSVQAANSRWFCDCVRAELSEQNLRSFLHVTHPSDTSTRRPVVQTKTPTPYFWVDFFFMKIYRDFEQVVKKVKYVAAQEPHRANRTNEGRILELHLSDGTKQNLNENGSD